MVELRDADRTLRLSLDQPAHAVLRHTHLARHGQAILYRATPAKDAEPRSEVAEALSRLEHRWRHRRTQAVPELSDANGMLEGSAGVALTDLAPPPDTGWDACLLTTLPTAGPIS